MFHWICPECGREIAPTVRECSVCDPVAATVEIAPAGVVEAPARAMNRAGGIPVEPAVAVTPSPALAERVGPVSPRPKNGSNPMAACEGTETLLPQFGVAASGRDPLAHLTAMLESLEPEPPLSREIMRIGVPPIPAALRALIAELGPAGASARIPLTPIQRSRAAEPPRLTRPIPLSFRPQQPQVSKLTPAMQLIPLPAGPGEVVRPHTRPVELEPMLAPLGKYSPLAGRPLRPAVPQYQVLKKETLTRTTLPGPMLTRRLVKFVDRELNPIAPAILRVKKPLIPGWMASALIIGTLLGAGFTGVIAVVRPAADAKQSVAAEVETPPAMATSSGASPVAKPIEVSGFRIQIDPAKKPEIQYLVVNHTASRWNGSTVNVTLYAMNAKAGQPPLCKFHFAAPNLGPYQAKEMTSAIEQVSRPLTLPDWEDLRAAVDITPSP